MKKFPWHIYGHQTLINRLEKDLSSNLVSHSTLIVGPANIGKFSLLRKMAQFLQSEDQESFECNVCRQIEADSHIDTIVFKRDGNDFGIKEFRKLKEILYLSPQSKYKIVLIQDIERLSIPLLNAMLKVLEEPPEKVKFLLTCSDVENVPETVVSRARTFNAGPASDELVRKFLLKSYGELNEEFLNEVVFFCAGRIGNGVRIVENSELHQNLVNWHSKIRFLDEGNNDFEALSLAEEISELDRADLISFLNLMLQHYRLVLMSNESRAKKHLISIKIQKIVETIDLIRKNVNIKIALEVLFLHCSKSLDTMQNH